MNAFTCPRSSEAHAFPLPDTVELFVPVVLKANDPVGFGGLRTSRASRRISTPNLIVCRRRTWVKVSRYSVIEVRKSELAAVAGPICWNPAMVKMGRTEPNEFAARPGTVTPPFCRDACLRSRLEYPNRA